MSTFKNFVQCRVSSPITAVADSIGIYDAVPPYTLPSEEGGLLVLTDSPNNPSKLEVISYTSLTDLALYGVTRGLEGTTAQEWTGPVYCYQSLLAGEFETLLNSKVDKVTGKGLSDTNFTQVEKTKLAGIASAATKNRADSLNADKVHTHTTAQVTGLDTALGTKASKTELTTGLGLKVDKVSGKGLSESDYTTAEKSKLAGVAAGATKNRADSENADKLHTHTTAQVTGLDTALAGKANTTTQVIAGTGLSGGGTLASNRTLNVSYGTAAGTAAQGNDSRINNGQTAFGWGNHASGGYAKTKADVGLSGIPDTNASTANYLRGDGTWVTPPNSNTTYSEISTAEIDAGTASTSRTISSRRIKYISDKKADTVHGHAISDVTGLQAAIDSKANTSTQVIAGTGLTGGGTLAANRTLTVKYGTAAGTAAQGNDSRINNGQTAFNRLNIGATAATARTALQLDTAATKAEGYFALRAGTATQNFTTKEVGTVAANIRATTGSEGVKLEYNHTTKSLDFNFY